MTENSPPSEGDIPIFLLKTKSRPTDAYEELFSAANGELRFKPIFVPVLDHKFRDDGLETVRALLRNKQFGKGHDCKYGGLIFTSQRAVEAFDKLVQEVVPEGESNDWPHLQDVPIYSVGPATSRALRAVSPSLKVFGEETGSGFSLSWYIMDHYRAWYPDKNQKPPLLFLVGEQRRDIIPSTLMRPGLSESWRVQVDEIIVYGTDVMESFGEDFIQRLQETSECKIRWVVVFSPTGCEAMLRGLGLLDPTTGKVKSDARTRTGSEDKRVYIITIGPTTRDHLKDVFDFEPDVCAEKPRPEAIIAGIQKFLGTK
ncbi:tetrapyrrole biosynthesis, uroporphyrinogen III synthase [Xylogone sp. PMI_703]|nr:tetrapyrrole biosynthesis, uroporphyrinogen III synthase [Xylogone sp. PMI_703]